jgi:hypothetical protein
LTPAAGDAGPIQPVSEKVSGIPEDNFTLNMEPFRQTFKMSNFFDRAALSQKVNSTSGTFPK